MTTIPNRNSNILYGLMPRSVGILLICLITSGCMQIDLNVKLEEDGSATYTEKIRYSKRFLDMEEAKGVKTLEARLSEAGAQERVKLLGKGAKLIKYTLNPTPGGGKESVAVYHIPVFSDLRLVSPYLALPEHEKRPIKFHFYPSYRYGGGWGGNQNYYGARPGWISISLRDHGWSPKARHPENLSPAELQRYRALLPVFKDLLKGFRLKMDLELYDVVRAGTIYRWGGGAYRGSRHLGTKKYQLLDIKPDKHRDRHGNLLVDNEEIMLDIIRGDWASGRILKNIHEWWRNSSLPAYRPLGHWHAIHVIPSEYLWTRYFEGMPKHMITDLETPEQRIWLAKTEEKKKDR